MARKSLSPALMVLALAISAGAGAELPTNNQTRYVPAAKGFGIPMSLPAPTGLRRGILDCTRSKETPRAIFRSWSEIGLD